MQPETLEVVLRLRRATLDEVRQSLKEQSAAAARAHDAVRAIEATIARETDAATDPGFDDGAVEAFAAWLPQARQHLSEAQRLQERLEAEVSKCRAELAVCRAAIEAVETLIGEQRAAEAEILERRAEVDLLEAVCRRAPSGVSA